MRIVTGISIASLVVSVITLALVLMLVADKPWESSPVELEMGWEISEAQRLEACSAIGNVFPRTYSIDYKPSAPPILMAILDNRCTRAELRAMPKDAD